MKKGIIAAAIALSMGMAPGASSAEQPAADGYRQIFASGKFYVEYKDNYTVRIIGEKDGKRMERTSYESGLSWMQYLNPLGMLFGGEGPKHPEVMYRDGKYYQFTDKSKAIVCERSKLGDENLDPREGWNGIGQKLALPVELAVFHWDDPYREKSMALQKPELMWSGKKTVDKKEYDCDRYSSPIKSASGGDGAYYVYEMLYENGNLVKIQSYVRRGEDEYPINVLSIKKISGDIPESLFKIGKNTKVYEAGIGDMNDLLDQPTQVETMEGL